MTSPFLQRIEDFLAAHPEVTPTRLGTETMKDPRFVADLKAGRSARESTIVTVTEWMDRYEAGQPAADAAKARVTALETLLEEAERQEAGIRDLLAELRRNLEQSRIEAEALQGEVDARLAARGGRPPPEAPSAAA